MDIGEVLRSSSRALVLQEFLAAQKGNGRAPKAPFRTTSPGLLETDAVDCRKEIDSVGRNAELNDRAGCREVLGRQPQPGEPELDETPHDAFAVLRRRFDEHIQVLGEARMTVEGQRVSTNDDRPNVVRVEGDEQFFEVVRWDVH